MIRQVQAVTTERRGQRVAGLLALVRQVRAGIKADNLSLVAAGVAYYGLLALFPALIATVTLYGLFADPERIKRQLTEATNSLPQGAADLISGQLSSVAAVGSGGLTIGLVISLGATLWAASGGVRALLLGLNVIFHATESRNLIRRSAVGLGLTIGAVLAVTVSLTLVAVFPAVLDHIGLNGVAAGLAEVGRWVLLVIVVLGGLAVLYRWGPDRPDARWRWLTPGTVLALVVWALGSIAFSIYVSNFGSYNETYGGIAAVIVLMLWLYLSALAILVGAEVDAVRERDKDVIHTTPPAL